MTDREASELGQMWLSIPLDSCGTCEGKGFSDPWNGGIIPCPSCHGRGTVYPPALVKRTRRVVDYWCPDLNSYAKEQFTLELLDALNDTSV